MVREHAVLPVRPGEEDAFVLAFREAVPLISRQAGFRSLSLDRCIERPSTFLLLVEWDSVDDHELGFRRSVEYQQWRRLLHRFYEPFPLVEHYEPVLTA